MRAFNVRGRGLASSAVRLIAGLFSSLVLFAAAPALAAADLGVAEYTFDPDPVPNGALTTFTVRVTNNSFSQPVSDAVVTIEVSDRFEVTDSPANFPSYCVLGGTPGAQTLTCSLPPIAGDGDPGDEVTFTYRARAVALGASNTTASVDSPTDDDPNGANDSLTIAPSVQTGADLTITKDDNLPPSGIAAGGTINYTLTANNAGPNVTAAVRVTDNLPAASDFDFASASGTNWSCSPSATQVVCDYTGPALQGDFPPITVSGQVTRGSGGSLVNNAFVELSSGDVLEPNADNNTASVSTPIQPGADLEAGKTMPPDIPEGGAANITLQIRNNGPDAVTGATITDNIAANFTIGTLPSGCSAMGQTVTCTAGTLPNGGTANFVIPVTATSTTSGVQVNEATVTAPPGAADPVPGNNSATAPFQVLPPQADLRAFKSKSPNPVQAGGQMTSVIRVRNLGPSVASYSTTAPIRVTDTVTADETFVSSDPAWSCSPAGLVITCETTGTGTLAVDAELVLTLTTQAGPGVDLNLTNTACTGATANSQATPPDVNSANDCAGAGVRSTPRNADLSIVKEVSLNPGGPWLTAPSSLSVPAGAPSFYIRLTVANAAGGDLAETVVVTDNLPNFLNSDGFTTGFAVVTPPASGAPAYTPSTGRISWTVTELAAGETDSTVIRIDRPVESGTFNNVATVTSPDTIETTAGNNSSTAIYDIAPVADITVNAKSVSPDPAQVGVLASYTISVRNNGPNPASDVQLTDVIDPSRFELVGSPNPTKPGATCTKDDASGEIACAMGSFDRGETFQVTQQIRSRFPFGGATTGFPIDHTNTATATTATSETNGGNNSFALNHSVAGPKLDLQITNTEPTPTANFDPTVFGGELQYILRVANAGPSRATNVVVTAVPQPPAGYTMTYAGFEANTVAASPGFSLKPLTAATCGVVASEVVCRLHSADSQNFLDAQQQVNFLLRFTTSGPAPGGSLTFATNARVVSAEQPTTTAVAADEQLNSNTEAETTTVLPSTDLQVVSKTRVTPEPVNINQPIEYAIVIRNNGTSPTSQVRLTDELPAGFVLVTEAPNAPSATPSGAATVSGMACSGTNTVLCVLDGNFPETGDTVTVRLFMRAAYPYTGPVNTDLTNTASIAVGLDAGGNPISRDTNDDNNSQTATVRAQEATLAGRVYSDANLNDAIDPGEDLAGVTITLTGTDEYGNTLAPRTTVTDASGAFLFDRLPGGTYTLVETQPAGHLDWKETAGSVGGVVDNTAFTNAAANNTIGNIVVPSNTAVTGYIFQEVQASSLEGYVYRDLDDDGAREAGETGFAPDAFPSAPHVRLAGVDFAGRTVALTQSTDANGRFQFTDLPPSSGAGYTLTQLVQPTGASDGKDSNGAGAVVTGSGGRPAPEDIVVGAVAPGAALTERNFGELPGPTLSGFVYFDINANAVKDPADTTGVPTVPVRLTGTDDQGAAVDCTVTTSATGAYSFPNPADPNAACRILRSGTYAVAVTPPNGLTHTGAFIGSLGGTSGGVTGANTPAPGAANTSITAIPLTFGAAATNYNFGESGVALSGYVYIDRNDNGVREPDEVGIAGVGVTLSGTTDTGADVCTVINCAAVTGPGGEFSYFNVPASNGAGYTLTEQSQGAAPLNLYADGQDSAGTVAGAARGSAGADVITGIVLGAGQVGSDYRFGERAASLSGLVFSDGNNDGAQQGGEGGIAGASVSLSGLTDSGQDICALRAARSPAQTCSTVTGPTGAFAFHDLPAGDYTLIETQPNGYNDGKEAAGVPPGAIDNSVFNNTPAANTIGAIDLGAGVAGAGYLFGEIQIETPPGGGGSATIAGRVFKDPQRDGVDGGGEPGIPDVRIELRQNGVAIATTVTGVDGAYAFANVAAGTYEVLEVQPAGYGSSSPNTVNVTAVNGATARADFAETVSTLAGAVYVDFNGDGQRQAGEPGIAGVEVRISGSAVSGASVNRTNVTDASGAFRFDDLLAGTYTVTETQPAAFRDGADTAGTAGGTVGPDTITGVALPPGVDATGYLFGEQGQGIAGVVYVDVNSDGAFGTGDTPIPGVTVRLVGPTGAVLRTTTTDVAGAYSFIGLEFGAYTVEEAQPDGYGQGQENGTDRATVTLTAEQPSATVNFGERLAGVSGVVYVDANENGARDPGETVLSGVTIRLTGPGGQAPRTTVTDVSGAYGFAGLEPGTYTVEEVQPAGYGDAAENRSNSASVDLRATPNATVNFGERAGSIAGLVYVDANNDGRRDPNEAPIPGVAIRLTGQDVRGQSVDMTVTGGADGTFRFTGLVAGRYALTETQPADFQDGQDTAGTAGGVASGDTIADIVLGPAQDATGYLFGELGQRARLSGSVWLDLDHDRARDPQEPVKVGWTVELHLGDQLVASTTTNQDGGYEFADIPPGTGYRLRFKNPQGVVFGGARPNEKGAPAPEGVVTPVNPGGARMDGGELIDIQLSPGANVLEQSLPLDPAGVVYDAVRRTPVAGAVVRFSGPAGFDADRHLVGGAANLAQTTAEDGFYQYLLLPGAPAGVYTLSVTPPAGYNPLQPSTLIPPCAGPYAAGGAPNPLLISSFNGAPPAEAVRTCATGAASTAYFLSFVLTPGVSADVVNNHLPVDPLAAGALVATKTTPIVNVTRGGLVPYVVTVRNASNGPIGGVTVVDRLPPGFRYRTGSGRVDGQPSEPEQSGRILRWPAQTFAPGQERRFELILTAGTGLAAGEHVNRAFAANPATDDPVSNIAEAAVRLTEDADFDCSDVLGKVFDDRNANGVQDPGEPGLAGVRLATVNGLLVTTDAEGRYHVTCPMIPKEDRGSNFILKLDARTLPTGYRVVTGNPETVRLTRGKFAKLNFGASLLRVVRIDLTAEAFEGEDVAEAFRPKIAEVVELLRAEPSVLRLAYHAAGEDPRLAARRTARLKDLIEEAWKQQRRRYRLIIEDETADASAQGGAK